MIQRLQTLYLLAVAAISLVLVLSDIPFYQETGKPVSSGENGTKTIEFESTTIIVDYNSTETTEAFIGKNDMLIYFLSASALLSFISIFLYKNRKLQLRLVFGIIVLTVVVFAAMYLFSFGNHYTDVDTQRSILMGSIIPIASLILALMAYRRIDKDEKLVRSLDRIR
ncbi:MAG: glucan phosphoethanolaminetransferase (alkaline phosphatase superfamily) [bacterium]|jgi:glucan phosphoethanolaminetransferase (alkaline phosphatase superfamily)